MVFDDAPDTRVFGLRVGSLNGPEFFPDPPVIGKAPAHREDCVDERRLAQIENELRLVARGAKRGVLVRRALLVDEMLRQGALDTGKIILAAFAHGRKC